MPLRLYKVNCLIFGPSLLPRSVPSINECLQLPRRRNQLIDSSYFRSFKLAPVSFRTRFFSCSISSSSSLVSRSSDSFSDFSCRSWSMSHSSESSGVDMCDEEAYEPQLTIDGVPMTPDPFGPTLASGWVPPPFVPFPVSWVRSDVARSSRRMELMRSLLFFRMDHSSTLNTGSIGVGYGSCWSSIARNCLWIRCRLSLPVNQ